MSIYCSDLESLSLRLECIPPEDISTSGHFKLQNSLQKLRFFDIDLLGSSVSRAQLQEIMVKFTAIEATDMCTLGSMPFYSGSVGGCRAVTAPQPKKILYPS